MSAVTGKGGNDADMIDTGGRNAAATQRVAERAHQTIDRAAELAAEAEQTVRSKAARAADKLKESEERAAEAFEDNVDRVRSYVERNPLTSAGIAFAAGVLVSVLLRR